MSSKRRKMKPEKFLYVFTDGGARGNPGPAAIGFVIKDNSGKVLIEKGKFIGEATNNVAEYKAVIEALRWIETNIKYQTFTVIFFLDSKLVVSQLKGLFRVKNKNLKNLTIEVKNLEKKIGQKIFYNHIPREKNKKTDSLVNIAIDKEINIG